MDRLPPSALAAWQAFNAMSATKQRHFDCMKLLEARYTKYGRPSAEENACLERLLDEHDAQVKAFLKQMNALKAADPDGHSELVRYLTRLSDLLPQDDGEGGGASRPH